MKDRVRLWAYAIIVVAATAMTVLGAPSAAHADSVRDSEWHLKFLDVAAAHRITEGDGLVVGLPDTGVDDRHPDLTGVVTGGTYIGGFGDPHRDSIGHGTEMAGIIAGRGHGPGHADGILGIAPRVSLLSIQTLFGDLGAPRDLGIGISWAVQHGARVICIAAVTSDDPQVRQGIQEAIKKDVVVVAGVGNKPDSTVVGFPSRLPGVLAVGGVDRNGNHADISVRGPEVMISAPAVDIPSTDSYSGYQITSGTSDATAIVTGAAALVRAKYPKLSAPEVIHRLTATATDKGPPGRDPEYGYGVLNIVKALTADIPPATSAPPTPASQAAPPPEKDVRGIPLAVPVGVGIGVLLTIGAISVITAYRRRRS